MRRSYIVKPPQLVRVHNPYFAQLSHDLTVLSGLADTFSMSEAVSDMSREVAGTILLKRSIISGSIERSQQALHIWKDVHGILNDDTQIAHRLQAVASNYEDMIHNSIARQMQSIDRYSKHLDLVYEQRRKIDALNGLSLAAAERWRCTFKLIEDGRMGHNGAQFIIEGAALVYLTAFCVQLDEISRSFQRRFVQPLLELLNGMNEGYQVNIIERWPFFIDELRSTSSIAEYINNTIRKSLHPALKAEEEASGMSGVRVRAALHMVNNGLTSTIGYLNLFHEVTEAWVESGARGLPEGLKKDLMSWNSVSKIISHDLFSDKEPIIHVGERFSEVELISEGSIPAAIDLEILNIITTHLTLNALAHPSQDRKPKTILYQTPSGVAVIDNGIGISTERLAEIEQTISHGTFIVSDHAGGTGNGLNDSVKLLKDLIAVKDRHFSAEIAIASKEGIGTVVFVGWHAPSEEIDDDDEDDGWNVIRFTSDDKSKVSEDLQRQISLAAMALHRQMFGS